MDDLSPKTKGIIAYLTFVGFLIAYFINKENKNEYATWHIKNMFGLLIGLFISTFVQNEVIGFYVYWTVACMWLYCLIMAIMGKKQGIPFLSDKFQDWFRFLN